MSGTKNMPVVRCKDCEALYIPPVYVCRKCHGQGIEEASCAGDGVVYTHTTIRVAPEALRDQAPYTIVIVELTPELRVTGRLEGGDIEGLEIGQPVRFTRVDEQGYWFSCSS